MQGKSKLLKTKILCQITDALFPNKDLEHFLQKQNQKYKKKSVVFFSVNANVNKISLLALVQNSTILLLTDPSLLDNHASTALRN